MLNGSENYGIDDLVQVGSHPIFYGQIQFFIEWLGEVVVGVQLDADQIHVRTLGSIISPLISLILSIEIIDYFFVKGDSHFYPENHFRSGWNG